MSTNRRKQMLNAVVAFAIASGGVYMGYKVMEKRIVDQQYVQVVAVKKGHCIEPYTPILASDLTFLPMSKDFRIPGTFADPAKIIGKKTYQKVGELTPILDWQLTDGLFLPDPTKQELQYEFNLSDFGPYTVIRTGDIAGIWVKYREEEEVRDGEVPKMPTLFTKTNKAADLLMTVRVAGIKDSEGAEVFSLLPPNLSAQVLAQNVVEGSDTRDRLAATFRGKPQLTPAKILLNLTSDQHKILQEAKQFGDWQIGVGFSPQVTPSTIQQDGTANQLEGVRP